MDTPAIGELLTHDEKKAAEAAFARRPFNPKWSAKARAVYDGLVKALPPTADTTDDLIHDPVSATDSGALHHAPDAGSESSEPDPSQHHESSPKLEASVLPGGIPFAQALETGALIDVTPAAKQLGFSFSVNLTRTLWNTGIAPNEAMPQEEQAARLRDVLMALRLRLATHATISPLIDFPALLTIPPNTVPQPVPLFALLQANGDDGTMVTVLLPNEVSTSIIPMN
ncbi:conserved protein of unknown function [Nitrospira japonica]|uniref:Uncharacterized protein n=1 Tax=Nitrospira japonica TaxID=1325564 RepID=A0A1W1I5Q6_9BACT|nr:DUF6573 family protein [Nitrospira japonica]SLM48315.1 conserved protein of unknown function [Nitrospira japonica]